MTTFLAVSDALTNETVELLQQLIRNRCVNDGTPESGEEARNSDLLQTYLEGAGLNEVGFDFVPMLAIAAVTLPLAAWLFRNRLS